MYLQLVGHISAEHEHFVKAIEIAIESHENTINFYLERELGYSVAHDQDFVQLLDTDLRSDISKEVSKSTNGI